MVRARAGHARLQPPSDGLADDRVPPSPPARVQRPSAAPARAGRSRYPGLDDQPSMERAPQPSPVGAQRRAGTSVRASRAGLRPSTNEVAPDLASSQPYENDGENDEGNDGSEAIDQVLDLNYDMLDNLNNYHVDARDDNSQNFDNSRRNIFA